MMSKIIGICRYRTVTYKSGDARNSAECFYFYFYYLEFFNSSLLMGEANRRMIQGINNVLANSALSGQVANLAAEVAALHDTLAAQNEAHKAALVAQYEAHKAALVAQYEAHKAALAAVVREMGAQTEANNVAMAVHAGSETVEQGGTQVIRRSRRR